jgi:ABC-2 type transport system ATP-binding protein
MPGGANMKTAVDVQAVSKRFGDMVAVDNLSFAVAQGEIFGLLGPNGAGKTTSINLITGMLSRDSGDIYVLGLDPQREARQVHQNIGFVPQDTNVYLDLNAIDNLWHHAALYCQDLSSVKEKAAKSLTMMNLWERRKDPVRTFSGGMKRRLALARALLHEPAIVFFDEPTLGVDVQGKHVLWQHIRDQRENGRSFIISTNDMAEAEALCDRLVIIDHGRVIALDTPEALKANLGRDIVTVRTTRAIANPDSFFAELPIQQISAIDQAGKKLRLEVQNAEAIVGELVTRISRHYQLESIRMTRPTLDDVFLHFTGRGLRE